MNDPDEATYAWKITQDYLNEILSPEGKIILSPDNDLGTMGPYNMPDHFKRQLDMEDYGQPYDYDIDRDLPHHFKPKPEDEPGTPNGRLFRIYDDDGTLYYEGVILGDYSGFEPLDDFGRPNAGAVDIAYGELTIAWNRI